MKYSPASSKVVTACSLPGPGLRTSGCAGRSVAARAPGEESAPCLVLLAVEASRKSRDLRSALPRNPHAVVAVPDVRPSECLPAEAQLLLRSFEDTLVHLMFVRNDDQASQFTAIV